MSMSSVQEPEIHSEKDDLLNVFCSYFNELIEFLGDYLLMDFHQTLSADSNVDDELQNKQYHHCLTTVTDWFRRMIHYNVPRGKLVRGLTVVKTFKKLQQQKPSIIDQADEQMAMLVGWCMEIFQTTYLIIDDIMDDSMVRRGQKCWHRLSDVGMLACNDSMLLEQSIYHLLRNSPLQDHPNYLHILHLFHESFLVTSMGQCLDMLSERSGKGQGQPLDSSVIFEDHFTMARFRIIARKKTGFYTFSMPIRLALYLYGLDDVRLHRHVNSIAMTFGELFQAQDDYLDCYGDPETMGKIGTDIRDGKCTWLVARAFELTNDQPEYREVIKKHYGKPNQEEEIKSLYKKLGLEHEFKHYHQRKLSEINKMIDNFFQKLDQEVFENISNNFFDDLLASVSLERIK